MKSGRELAYELWDRIVTYERESQNPNGELDDERTAYDAAKATLKAIASDLDTLAKAQEAAAPLEQWLEDFDKFAPHTASSSSDWAVSFLSHGLNVNRLRTLLTILRKADHG